jgi:hypothetical protein
VVAWILIVAGVLASVCWLASLRKGDYRDHVTIIEHFGWPGSNSSLDFLRGEMRLVVKDYDIAWVYLVVPGWAAALGLGLAGYALRFWSLRQRRSARGFEPRLAPRE